MYQSFVTTAPQPLSRVRDSLANVLCFCIVPIVRGKCQVFDKPRQTCLCKVAGENCHGFSSLLFPQCGRHSRELLDEKSKSSLFPGAGGCGYK